MVELHAQSASEHGLSVGHQPANSALGPLGRGPTLHHGAIVHAEDDNIRNTLSFQLISLSQVARDLLRGSGRCESTRQAHEHYLLAVGERLHGMLRRRETLVQGNITWEAVTDLDNHHGLGATMEQTRAVDNNLSTAERCRLEFGGA